MARAASDSGDQLGAAPVISAKICAVRMVLVAGSEGEWEERQEQAQPGHVGTTNKAVRLKIVAAVKPNPVNVPQIARKRVRPTGGGRNS
jgi:hypothetical protein